MIHDPDRFVGTLLFVGAVGWLAISTTAYAIRCRRENQAVKRLEAMRNHPSAWIEEAVDRALWDGVVPKPRDPVADDEVAQLRAELDDPTLVRLWMS